MKKQLNYKNIFTETLILTGAIAIISAAVYFFLVPSHTSDYRLSYLRSGIWCKNRIYQHHAPGLSWNI